MKFIEKLKKHFLIRKWGETIVELTNLGYVVHATIDSVDMHQPGLTCSICCEHCNTPFNSERFTFWAKDKMEKHQKEMENGNK